MKKLQILVLFGLLTTFASAQSSKQKGQNTDSSYIPQKEIIRDKVEMNEETVLVCNGGSAYAYHSHYCRGLSRCSASVEKMTKSEAVKKGRRPCKICY